MMDFCNTFPGFPLFCLTVMVSFMSPLVLETLTLRLVSWSFPLLSVTFLCRIRTRSRSSVKKKKQKIPQKRRF
ncbi:hypothetical protein BDV26DRAFT_261239 [Aspergillus bertholletiae]|uniref:Uncharacterized protein n=1 Tax=Aspergillus bertholletiae TaxID=1226010 RepID=A0A5N7BA54_9EURO|nr:hypothetical protein BDV26DRAFT_261239 [Aspergillus bertholletiae]